MEDGYAGCAVGIYTAAKPKEVVFCNLSLTETAAKTLSSMAAQQYEDNWYLYITIVGGGCSGYLYDVIVSRDIEIVINVDDSTLLNEIEIDWDDSLMGGGLKFRNPNATKTCSCGISFK